MISNLTRLCRAAWRCSAYLHHTVRPQAATTSTAFPQHTRLRHTTNVTVGSPLPWVDIASTFPTARAENPLKITFFCDSFNGLSQRLFLELVSRGHHVTVHVSPCGGDMVHVVETEQPDLVLCPYLTRRVPAQLCNNKARPVLIVHPGIPGDRGPSSMEWALKEGATEWGVSVLQAANEMDSGDIWATCKFPVPNQHTKSSLYNSEVTQGALVTVLSTLEAWEQNVSPTPLDYSHPQVKGQLRRRLTLDDRRVDWALRADDVARAVRACDSQPGALGVIRLPVQGHLLHTDVVLFGASVEEDQDLVKRLKKDQSWRVDPGDVIGQRNGAILVTSGDDGAVWISHLKASPEKSSLKLPATSVISSIDVTRLPTSNNGPLPPHSGPKTFQDVWMTLQDGVCYVHFDFYNGAMSTEQCRRLEQLLLAVNQNSDCSVVVLMGGSIAFSNGIHLNVIENAECAVTESWANINAINDVVKAIFSMRDKVTVAALRGGAGAGGAMMAMAADRVWSHSGVVLNPHYRKMALYGSEYWTYFLPHRVGTAMAGEITTKLQPVLATEAWRMGMIDHVIGSNASELVAHIHSECLGLQKESREIVREKRAMAPALWSTLERHRYHELERMRQCFEDAEYHERRRKFVFH